ncbi:tetratricopeptide repeat protein 13-like [Tachysurus ichikawai]
MAPAGRAVVLALSLLYLCGSIVCTEYFSTLAFFNGELNERGCGPSSEWEEYSPDCDPNVLQLEDPDCEDGSNVACESVFSLNAEKILSQARLFVEQRRFPFPVDDHNTNEELAIGYVLIGNGLYDEAIKHFSLLLQGDPELVSAMYGRGIAYGKKSLQDSDAVCNLVLSLVYYFCNLMPLSRGSSIVAYSVVMGALMASGKEVVGRIPSGKLVDFEAMTTPSPDRFTKTTKSWMNLKSLPSWYQNLPSVSETFQFARTMIEVLNTDSSSHCPKRS